MEYIDTPERIEAPFAIQVAGASPLPRGRITNAISRTSTRYETVYDFPGYSFLGAAPTGAVFVIDPMAMQFHPACWFDPDDFPSVLKPVAEKSATSPWISELAFVRKALSLPLTDFASVLKVTRPALYGWLRGEQPNLANQSRINSLSQIASAWDTTGLGSVKRYWNVPQSSPAFQLRSFLLGDDLRLDQFNAIVATIGAPRRLLPGRASKPKSGTTAAERRTRGQGVRTWRSYSADLT